MLNTGDTGIANNISRSEFHLRGTKIFTLMLGLNFGMLIIIINIIDDDLSSSSMSSSLALLVLDVVVARKNVDLKEVLDTVLASRMGEPELASKMTTIRWNPKHSNQEC